MPYFNNHEINLLFIHIPKTGGTSLEFYFSSKYNIELSNNSCYDHFINYNNIDWSKYNFNKIFLFRNIPLQHFTYKNIINNKHILNINFDDNNLKIITVVRNPYYRIISDLFWLQFIDLNTKSEEVFIKIKEYLYSNYLDNHNIPQYLFLIDHNEKLIDSIQILKTETLNEDMKKIGYSDFDLFVNDNQNKNIDYLTYLNKDSIELINNYYDKDFTYFNYEKIIV